MPNTTHGYNYKSQKSKHHIIRRGHHTSMAKGLAFQQITMTSSSLFPTFQTAPDRKVSRFTCWCCKSKLIPSLWSLANMAPPIVKFQQLNKQLQKCTGVSTDNSWHRLSGGTWFWHKCVFCQKLQNQYMWVVSFFTQNSHRLWFGNCWYAEASWTHLSLPESD